MRISKLGPIARERGRWLAELEDGSSLRLTEAEMADFALYAGMELDDATLNRLRRAASYAQARDKAMKLIAIRPMSRAELLRKLAEKGGGATRAQEAAADRLEQLGLLNDAEYARMVVSHYSAKGYGYYKIREELSRRGISSELRDESLAELGDPAETIDRFLRAKLPAGADRQAIKKCADALARRGFSYGDIRDGLRRWAEVDFEEV